MNTFLMLYYIRYEYLFNATASSNVSGIVLFIVSGNESAISLLASIIPPNIINGRAFPNTLGINDACHSQSKDKY
jgi:hypothetical protein